MVKDRLITPANGYGMLFLGIVVTLAGAGLVIFGAREQNPFLAVGGLVVVLAGILWMAGLFIVNPNEARVLQLFGSYTGTTHDPGLRWANPFLSKAKVSLRVRNFETNKIKVNDSHGNPVEIAAVVVWQVVDSAEAIFEVDDFTNYVHVQSESAVRSMTTNYPYDSHGSEEISLSGNTAEVSGRLQQEIQDRLEKAGVRVLEARISHLAYAQEIAAAMLQRQQAQAVVAARQQIVEGAVGMVDMALARLAERGIVHLDEERKAAMVSNLLVVLCSDRHAQPVINTGTLYN